MANLRDFAKNASEAVKLRNPNLFTQTEGTPNPPRKTEEADLQTEIITHLQTHGYLVAHFRPAKTEQGWRTPVEGDGAGFPDIIAVHPTRGRCVVLELKSEKGRIKEKQLEWLRALMNVQGVTVMVVRPSNWKDLRSLL